MHSANCSTDAPRASGAGHKSDPLPRYRWLDLLRGLAPIVGSHGGISMAAYVALSLGAAVAGSIAAIVLVPLIQPGHAPRFGGHALPLPTGIGILASILAAALASHALLRWLVSSLGARMVSDCTRRLRNVVHARLIYADIAVLDDSMSPEIANVLTSNARIIGSGVGALLQLLVAGVTTVVHLAIAFWVSPVLTLILPALAGLGLVASHYHGHSRLRISQRYVEDTTRLFRFSENFPHRLRHVRSFERTAAEKAGFGAVSASLAQGDRRQVMLVASGKLIMELVAAAGMAGIFLLAGRWRGVDQASLIAVGLLLGRLLPYMTSTRDNFQQLRLTTPAFELWQRYTNLEGTRHDAEPGTDASTPMPPVHIECLRLARRFLHVAIAELPLVPGEMTLVAGNSGIGKSSLADVLAGMTAPAAFAASVGQQPLDFEAYRQLVHRGAYVSQNVRPWQRSVRECLLWAAPDASDTDLHDVLADVGLDTRLQGTHEGLDAELQGPSCRLSGGELQRLLLAQVILRQPSIAILDETTGALDAASEMHVLTALKRSLPQTILIVVSHRHGPLDIADQCLRIGQDGIATVIRKPTVSFP
jgi:ATP-binding cassette subfamily C protein